jgi:hypothetical protein
MIEDPGLLDTLFGIGDLPLQRDIGAGLCSEKAHRFRDCDASVARIVRKSLGNRFCTVTLSVSSLTTTTLLFECRSIPPNFISATVWLKQFAKPL